MSFLAKLILDEQEYNVLSFSIEIYKQVQPGRAVPTSMPIINHLHLTIESDSDSKFFAWVTNPSSESRNGEIIFYKRDSMSTSRKYTFEDAFLVNYTEKFESNSTIPIIMGLELAVSLLILNDGPQYEDIQHLGD